MRTLAEEMESNDKNFSSAFHVQISGIFEIFLEEIDLTRVAFSCHFALDLLCDKARTKAFRLTPYLAPLPVVGVCFVLENTPQMEPMPPTGEKRNNHSRGKGKLMSSSTILATATIFRSLIVQREYDPPRQ